MITPGAHLSAGERSRSRTAWTAAAWAFSAVAFGLLVWRASLPNAQHRDNDVAGDLLPGEMWHQNGNGFDDVVTVVTARNFARDGFLRTHFLPNRKGAPLVSFFDFSQTQCLSLAAEGRPPLRYRNTLGAWVDMPSLDRDCVYTHYPPLADWVFGSMAALGLDSIFSYRLLAILLSCATLGLLFHWLRREVHPAAALAAVALVAISPAFFHWAGALFYPSFQYLFLAGGLVSWSRFLEERRRRWFVVTYALFLLEGLVSYELVAFFAIVVAGLAALDGGDVPWRRRLGWIAVLATAPLAAFLLHQALAASLFGVAATWDNLVTTVQDRVVHGEDPYSRPVYWNRVRLWLSPPALAALAGAVALAVRYATRSRPGRAAALLALMLLGGFSFLLLLPGTAWRHAWIMYRHLLPATALLFALAADAVLRCVRFAPSGAWRGRTWPAALLRGAAAVALLVPLGGSVRQSGRALRREVGWTRAAAAQHDPANEAVRFLDVVYWFETGAPDLDVRALLTVDGRRHAPLGGQTLFPLRPGVRQHLEIWWLDEVPLESVRALSGERGGEALARSCAWSALGDAGFQAVAGANGAIEPFQPARGEHASVPLVWWARPLHARTRALRLTCEDLPFHVPVFEIEARKPARAGAPSPPS